MDRAVWPAAALAGAQDMGGQDMGGNERRRRNEMFAQAPNVAISTHQASSTIGERQAAPAHFSNAPAMAADER